MMEIPVDPQLLRNKISSNDKKKYSLTYQILKEKLIERIMQIAAECLTRQQFIVLNFFLAGKKEKEIAQIIKTNQSRVCKILHGNYSYKYNSFQGGAFKALRKQCQEDAIILDILSKIRNVSQEEEEIDEWLLLDSR